MFLNKESFKNIAVSVTDTLIKHRVPLLGKTENNSGANSV